ncbi:hypothetical protein [uncultured Paludibaculum sp.]|uniref:hypothetical protein n=1 Tax=uncultured Paludibaculum sp. TaxID=1765020 RepID=UPI002AAC385D|nr:hypothetical protein [uncultured Paludibaculum sp.]
MVGLFHFNVQYVAGDVAGYHRYRIQTIGPFLSILERNPRWRVSFEMSGSGLEFINQFDPMLVRRMRRLIEAGQLELVSSTYSPSLWVAFPRRDLVKSIELNRKCLQSLGLPISRIFFAQEAFFGAGLGTLSSCFDAVVCKDDYISYFSGDVNVNTAYRLDDVRVIVGSNHLVNELAALSRTGKLPRGMAQRFTYRFARAEVNLPAIRQAAFSTNEWGWYHLGSGHHACMPADPGDWDNFFSNSAWTEMFEWLVNTYLENGCEFRTLAEYADAINLQTLPSLPPVIEGSWNSQRSEGVYTWMGKQAKPWENDTGILALAWRSRQELVLLEEQIRAIHPVAVPSQLTDEVDRLWTLQLMAESSDSLGWSPTSSEVRFSPSYAEDVFKFTDRLRQTLNDQGLTVPDSGVSLCTLAQASEIPATASPFCKATLVGGDGVINTISINENLQLLDLSFEATDSNAGITIESFPPRLIYCPSGQENVATRLEWTALHPATLFIPLANGLLGLADELYLIRNNIYSQVAARADKTTGALSFLISGAEIAKVFHWQFYIYSGELRDAVILANAINCI